LWRFKSVSASAKIRPEKPLPEGFMSTTEVLPRRHRISVDDYYRMAEVGLLAPDARVELIEGEVIDMAPTGSRHGSLVDILVERFVQAFAGKAIVRSQGAVQLDGFSQPQPDVALLKPRPDRYRSQNPSGRDTFLVIEVSDSTLLYDRQIKVPLYARHGVPEVWIVDAEDSQLHCFRSLVAGEYTRISSTAEPGCIAIDGLDGVTADLTSLFR
jgi:Uma2 family endonuclease